MSFNILNSGLGLQVGGMFDLPQHLTSDNADNLRNSVRPIVSSFSPSGYQGDNHIAGNWDDPNPTPALTIAALAGLNAPNRSGMAGLGQNWIQGLANTFGQQQEMPYIPTTMEIGGNPDLNLPLDTSGIKIRPTPNMEPDALLKNPNWNMLYQVDPQKANLVYKNATGRSFDEVLKERENQKKFIRKTIESRIAKNELRQDEVGNWLEIGDVPDTSPSAMPGATKKTWAPASLQTQSMVEKLGGAKALGLNDFNVKGKSGADVLAQLLKAGWTPEGAVKFMKDHVDPPAQSSAAAQIAAISSPQSNHRVGLVPALGGVASGAMRMLQTGVNDERPPFYGEAAGRVLPAMGNNLMSLIFGGDKQSLNPEVTNEDMQRIRASLLNR